MSENALIPTDGCKGSQAAIDEGLDIAATYDAIVHVGFVADTSPLPAAIDQGALLSERKETGQQIVAEVLERADERESDTHSEILGGAAPQTIGDYAAEHDVDLIVMGAHGRTRLQHLLVGSVTERTTRLTDASPRCQATRNGRVSIA